MRTARIIAEGESYYHCVSRIVHGQPWLNDMEKEIFRKTMRSVADFTGVEVLTYALMDNHIHLLLKVPEKCEIAEEDILRRIRALYGKEWATNVAFELKQLCEDDREAEAEALLRSYTYRIHDLSQFMKMLMQRFTASYNKRHGLRGHLWEERFRSILVEGKPDAISMIAGYIELNAVRVGIVEDPKDFLFCGYGEAVAGNRRARKGILSICALLGHSGNWTTNAKVYRTLLNIQSGCKSIDREKVQKVLDEGGKLSKAELSYCRVRYLSDGVVLGSKDFVEDVFQKHRQEFGLKRKTGARKPRYGDWGELCTMRNLRVKPVSLPSQN